MFVGKQQVEDVQKGLDELRERVGQQTLEVVKLKETNEELQTELDDSRQSMQQLQETLQETTQTLSQSVKQMNNEVVELKLYLSKTRKELVTDLTSEFSQEMKNTTGQLLDDVQSLKKLKDSFASVEDDLSAMRNDVLKFLAISEKVSETDFELTNYQKTLEMNDKEKLDLLRKIDSLERLVAKQRSGPKF
tara:strand:+ start:186 stop:758 length:573 start_codon:yes stop_codon:yes gene_type:complete